MFAYPDLPAGANQALPVVRLAADLAGQQNLISTLQKAVRGWVLRAQRLRPQTAAVPIQPGRKHPRIVEDD